MTKPVTAEPSEAEIKQWEEQTKANPNDPPRKPVAKQYLDPKGPSLKEKSSFFGSDDETMVFIFAPLRADANVEFV